MGIGLIGLGPQMLEKILPAIRICAVGEITSVCVRTESSATLAKAMFPIATIYFDLESLVSDRRVDYVFVASTPEVHVNAIIVCWRLSKPIFVEKPSFHQSIKFPGKLVQSTFAKTRAFVGHNIPFSAIGSKFLSLLSESDSKPISVVAICSANKPSELIWDCQSIFESFIYAVGVHALDSVSRIISIDSVGRIDTTVLHQSDSRFRSTSSCATSDNEILTFLFTNMLPVFEFQLEVITGDGSVYKQHGLSQINYQFGKRGSCKSVNTINNADLSMDFNGSGYIGEVSSFFSSLQRGSVMESSLSDSFITSEFVDKLVESEHNVR